MTDLIAGITAAIDITKQLRELNKKVGEADFKMFLADLTLALGEAKLEAGNLKGEIADLRQANTALLRQISIKTEAELEIDEGCYMFTGSDRHYCIACYQSKIQKNPMIERSGHWRVFGKWECPVCKKDAGPAIL